MMGDMTQEDADYLQEHPAFELSLWREWVVSICGNVPASPPTGGEWDALERRWHHGKAPLESFDELQQLRMRGLNPQPSGD